MPWPRTRLTHSRPLIVVAFLALLAAGGGFAGSLAAAPRDPLVLRHGALLGAWVGGNGRSDDRPADVAAFEDTIGRRLAIDAHYYSWTDKFPGAHEAADLAAGRIPLITWEPFGADIRGIARGDYDDLIRQRADALRQMQRPVFLRWGHEMNAGSYPWSGAQLSILHRVDGPKTYVRAWQHIHDIFRRESADNVRFVWCPNAEDVPAEPWNHWSLYYPGDRYVDWVGIDAYNFGDKYSWSRWRSLASIIQPIYDEYHRRKPIMIAETGSVENGGDKAKWISDADLALRTRFPDVKAVIWFHASFWRLTTSSRSLSAFRKFAAQPYFNR